MSNLICSAKDAYEILGLLDPLEFEFKIMDSFSDEHLKFVSKHKQKCKEILELRRQTGRTTRALVRASVLVLSGVSIYYISPSNLTSVRAHSRFLKIIKDLNKEFNIDFSEWGSYKFGHLNSHFTIGIAKDKTKIIFDL